MTTKQTKSVTDKKVSVPTKQVPTKTTPAKPAKVQVHDTKETPKSPAVAVARKLTTHAVKQAKAKADTALAKANLAKAKVKQADANAKLKKIDAEIKAAKSIAKATAPLKKTIKKPEEVINSKKTFSKTQKKDGVKTTTPLNKTLDSYKALSKYQKAELAKNMGAVVSKTNPAPKRPKQVNKDTAVFSTSVDEKSIIPSVLAAKPEASVTSQLAKVTKSVAQPAKPTLPPVMSGESAIKREEMLRRTFGTLIAGAAR